MPTSNHRTADTWRSSENESKSKQALADGHCASVPDILQRHTFMIMGITGSASTSARGGHGQESMNRYLIESRKTGFDDENDSISKESTSIVPQGRQHL